MRHIYKTYTTNDYTYYLLLTELEYDDYLGYALLPGRYGWAKVSGQEHTTPSHEIGHMFGTKHTTAFYRYPWWRNENMMPRRTHWFIWYKTHLLNSKNRSEISSNLFK